MTHVRQQIRSAIATLCEGGTVPASRIFTSRSYPMDVVSDNAICVYTSNSEHSASAMGGLPEGKRTVMQWLTVECWVAGPSATVDDLIDDIAEYVEDQIASDPTLGGLVKNVQMIGDSCEVNTEGGNAIGSIAIDYSVTYRRSGTASGVTVS